jgi:hypothetical protein
MLPGVKDMCRGLLPPALGEDAEAAAALENRAERAIQPVKAKGGGLSSTSICYHPRTPLPDQIDHLAVIDLDCGAP